MKKAILSVAVVIFTFGIATAEKKHETQLTVNTSLSKIGWMGKKVTGQHNGNIQLKSGTIILGHNTITGGSFEIDMTTINTTDLTGELKGKLEGHLKSNDFFGVDKFPTATVKIIIAEKGNGDNYNITGSLTLRGITQVIAFPATVLLKGDKLTAVATIIIDRTKFGIKYGSGSFFEGLGDKMISDEFEIKLNIAAAKN